MADIPPKTCSQLAEAQYVFCPVKRQSERGRVLFYGTYLLPYNSEFKLVHIEEVCVIDFPLQA